jgi:hypothetical protein
MSENDSSEMQSDGGDSEEMEDALSHPNTPPTAEQDQDWEELATPRAQTNKVKRKADSDSHTVPSTSKSNKTTLHKSAVTHRDLSSSSATVQGVSNGRLCDQSTTDIPL